MHKIKIMDAEQAKPSSNKNLKSTEKIIKINDNLFEIGIRKGLIEKNEDGCYFVGDYEDLLAFINSKKENKFEWLD